MLIRLLAVVFTFGLLAGSVEARPADPVSVPTIALVDDTGSDAAAPDLELALPIGVPLPESLAYTSHLAGDAPPHHAHLSWVFRPPRVPAFN